MNSKRARKLRKLTDGNRLLYLQLKAIDKVEPELIDKLLKDPLAAERLEQYELRRV